MVGPSTSQIVQGLRIDGVEPIDHVLRRDALLFRRHGDRCPVLVRPRDHQDTAAFGTFVPVLDVGWQVATGDVSKVQRAVGVRPCHANEDVVGG